MDQPATRDATASEADVVLRRLAARGGVCGAVLVPGTLLVLCQIVLTDGAIAALPLALVAAALAGGVSLMLLARRAGRPTPAARPPRARFPLRVVGKPDADGPRTSRRSAA